MKRLVELFGLCAQREVITDQWEQTRSANAAALLATSQQGTVSQNRCHLQGCYRLATAVAPDAWARTWCKQMRPSSSCC
jgi:hypothetical protein